MIDSPADDAAQLSSLRCSSSSWVVLIAGERLAITRLEALDLSLSSLQR